MPVTVSYPFDGRTPLVVAVPSLDNGAADNSHLPKKNNRPMTENAIGWGHAADVKRSRCRRRRAVPVREESPPTVHLHTVHHNTPTGWYPTSKAANTDSSSSSNQRVAPDLR